MKLYQYISILFVPVMLILSSCNETPMSPLNNSTKLLNKDIDSSIQKVANMRIFFGHQSVGKNILDGINDISLDTNQKINIIESKLVDGKIGAAFFHSFVGKNKDPLSKISDFEELIENGIGDKVDVAFLKFCYVDFGKMTDIYSTFQKYKKTMESLKKKYHQTTFVHVTVPLVEAKLGMKGNLKKILGRYDTRLDGNIKRNLFNTMIKDEYEGEEPVFDLAAIESTYPDGKKETFTNGGSFFYALVPTYTDDGGHLNMIGRKVVASKLLTFLASL